MRTVTRPGGSDPVTERHMRLVWCSPPQNTHSLKRKKNFFICETRKGKKHFSIIHHFPSSVQKWCIWNHCPVCLKFQKMLWGHEGNRAVNHGSQKFQLLRSHAFSPGMTALIDSVKHVNKFRVLFRLTDTSCMMVFHSIETIRIRKLD